jgi:shikimate kinase
MMGVGKSTIGKKMASILGYTFIDLDKEIEKQEGKSISTIFENEGEEYFRKLESQTLQSIKQNKIIIATGGGTPCYNNNMEHIKMVGTSIYLKANSALIFDRIHHHIDKRPLLKGMNEEQLRTYIEHKIIEREPYYSRADYVFDIPASSSESIVKSISLDLL